MKVGIDWDGTVSADPTAFKGVVTAFLDAGHDVAIVTWRTPETPSSDMEEVFNEWGFKLPIIYCSGRAKREFYSADIWIEDNPAAVLFSLTRPPRFESDPSAYLKDILVCEKGGFDPVYMEWDQLKSRGEVYHG